MNRRERRARGIDVGQAEVLFEGRTLEVKVVINTDETVEEVVARLIDPAKGPKRRMVLVAGGEVEVEVAKKLWEAVLPSVRQQASKGGTS